MEKEKKAPLLLRGILRVHPRGFGFLHPEDKSYKKSIFIPKSFTLSAVDGDEVEVEIGEVESEKGPEGKVIKILTRNRTHVVGITLQPLGHGEWLVHVPLFGAAFPIRMLATKENA